MIQAIQERFNLNLLLVVLFILGIGVSLYNIYSLPFQLRMTDGYSEQFLPVYISLAVTFLIGLLTVVNTLREKREVLVFREKIIDAAEAKREAAEQEGKTTISLDNIRTALAASVLKTALGDALQYICKEMNAGQGALYLAGEEAGKRVVELHAGYALPMGESSVLKFEFGEGIVGQVAISGQTIFIDEVPDGYITVLSGLGKSSPKYLLVAPVKSNNGVAGVIEIATFVRATEDQRKFVEECAQLMSEKITTKG